ncbi:MAG TPA: DUF2092 domain-containing protein [Thermoanaerobaculia bacterium]
MNTPFRMRALGALGLAALFPAAASPETPGARVIPTPVATPAPAPPLEPAALERMKAMSDLLKSAGSFSFKAVTDRETPSVNGPLLDFVNVSKVSVTRPNQVRVESDGDQFSASLWYDGKTVTIWSAKSSFYGQTAALATIDETLQMLMDRFNTPFPVAGFLLKDPYARMIEGVQSAFDAGTARIDGVACRHFAFSEPDADWQVWIEEGARPLPRRMAVTYKNAPGRPRVLVGLSDWNLSATFPAGEFVFTPPAGSTRVEWKTVQK